MALGGEVRGAFGLAMGVEVPGTPGRDDRRRALALLPAVGAVLGGVAALAGWAAAIVVAPLGAAVTVATSWLLAGASRRAATGSVLGAVLIAAELVAVAAIPVRARMLPVAVAAMLARWAFVVQCQGRASSEPGTAVGAATFREVGWASATALGATLALLEAVGLLVVVVAAIATLLLRVAMHRSTGAMPTRGPRLTEAIVEAVALAVFAVVSRVAA